MAVLVRTVPGGCRLGLRVKPGSRRERLVGALGERLKLEVQAPPERGRANAAVENLLGELLGVAAHRVAVVAGASSQDKIVEVTGMTAADLATRLRALGVSTEEVPRITSSH